MDANGSNPSPKEIIIDLSESQNADLFKGGEDSLLQQAAFKQVKEIIRKVPAKIEKFLNTPSMNNQVYPRSHDVITINGARGSGKTTFILNILELIPHWNKDAKCCINNLGIIDPTLIEDCEHIFLTVIGKIREAVDRHWENGRIGSNAESIDDRYEEWRISLTKLAGGLRNLSKKKATDGESWSDPQFIMAEGLDNATQGVKLEWHFHNFVRASLRFIEAEAFVIALDDVDTKVDAGWPVLEVLRKYLTTPQLIVILSGDIQLYTQLILSKQCKQIDVNSEKIIEKPVEYEGQRNLVNDLTEQYMMKIMRPDYRIEMQTVAQIAKNYGIRVKSIKDEKPQKLSKLLEEFCEHIYGSKFQLYHLAQVLTEVPTRTCIQLLNTATEFLNSRPKDDNPNPDDMKKIHMEAVAGLGHVFQNALARAGLSSKLVNEVDSNHMTLGRLAIALEKKKLLKQGYHLFPIIEKPWQRQLMMILGAVYTISLSKQPAMIFGYQIYICLPAYLQGILIEKDFQKYIEISQLETEIEAINAVKRGTKYIWEEINDTQQPDTIKDNYKVKIETSFCLKKVDNVPAVTSWHHYLLNMASVFTETDSSTDRYISFTALLASIATLAGSVKRTEDNEGEVDTVSVINIMRQYGSADNQGFRNGLDDTKHETPQDSSKSQDAFAKLFATWCWSFPESSVFPLLAIAESWSRFSSATTRLSKGPNQEEKNPGDYIQKCIILYLNNLLEYELIIMRDSGITIEPDDNQYIENRFGKTLSSYIDYINQNNPDDGARCKIFHHVFSCPIWMHFLDLNSEDEIQKSIVKIYFSLLYEREMNEIDMKEETNNISSCITRKKVKDKVENKDKITNLFAILKGTNEIVKPAD